uniref:G-protein coupled receptors family 1 profile domain-containing protein n=1 Tax=Echeneis naucrates TaxID=173247 RepID=A0A665WJB5_ECHNA
MADNNSLVGNELMHLSMKDNMITVQLLVIIFLFINLLLIITFFQKECFYTTTRYILFAVTLLSDSLMLFLSDVLAILTQFNIPIHVWLCVIICAVLLVYATVTPVTLTAMTLERYVAVCMPLHHGELCSTRNTINCILIIHFLIMCIILVFCYVKIMKVAKAASGEDKQSSRKGLRTVALHGFQLLLCVIQLWCPFIESTLFHIDFVVFHYVRYFNYIVFYLVPKCLSPLIYGLRDEIFFHALKSYLSFGLYKGNLN